MLYAMLFHPHLLRRHGITLLYTIYYILYTKHYMLNAICYAGDATPTSLSEMGVPSPPHGITILYTI